MQKFVYDSCDHSDFTISGYLIGLGDEAREQCICTKCGKYVIKYLIFERSEYNVCQKYNIVIGKPISTPELMFASNQKN